MQPYAPKLNWSPNCLFKWQVIPSKQITPANQCACVVFLPQIVAYEELLGFDGIDLGDCRIKQCI
jgi:hypothetical protein